MWRSPLRSEGVPTPHQAPQAVAPVSRGEVPIAFDYENQRRLILSETEGCWRHLLRDWHMELLKLTQSKPQCWGSSSESARET